MSTGLNHIRSGIVDRDTRGMGEVTSVSSEAQEVCTRGGDWDPENRQWIRSYEEE